jgi:hypothetical protein
LPSFQELRGWQARFLEMHPISDLGERKEEKKKKKFEQARITMLGSALKANQPSSIIACIKS